MVFFGSCDICAQAMDLDDDEFQYFLKNLLKHIGVSQDDIDELITKWMLDEMDDDELFLLSIKGLLVLEPLKQIQMELGI